MLNFIDGKMTDMDISQSSPISGRDTLLVHESSPNKKSESKWKKEHNAKIAKIEKSETHHADMQQSPQLDQIAIGEPDSISEIPHLGHNSQQQELSKFEAEINFLMEQKRYTLAYEKLIDFEKNFKSSPKVYLNIAECCRQKDDYISAIDTLEKAIDLDASLPCSLTSYDEYLRNKEIMEYSNNI